MVAPTQLARNPAAQLKKYPHSRSFADDDFEASKRTPMSPAASIESIPPAQEDSSGMVVWLRERS